MTSKSAARRQLAAASKAPPDTALAAPDVTGDSETVILKQVVTLGTLIKILLACSGLLVGIGVYEINQIDKLRDETRDMKATVAGLEKDVEHATESLREIKEDLKSINDYALDQTKKIAAQPKP